MTRELNVDQAKNMAKTIINNHISSFSIMEGKDVSLDDNIISGKRFWVFFWNNSNQVFDNNSVLSSGFGCLINDRGETRTIFDIRKRPDKLKQFLQDAKNWAERPE